MASQRGEVNKGRLKASRREDGGADLSIGRGQGGDPKGRAKRSIDLVKGGHWTRSNTEGTIEAASQ